jgi:hypothetical protein
MRHVLYEPQYGRVASTVLPPTSAPVGRGADGDVAVA